ncbi:MAG: hypothetical protein ACKVJ1_10630, partial [Verrucomicrobiia bacterium]
HKAKTKALQKTTDWQKVEIVFDNTQAGPLTVNCLFGGWGQAKGTAWFDDISLQEVKPLYKESAEQKEVLGLAKSGEDIFHKHAVASCVRCHRVGNEGGVIGLESSESTGTVNSRLTSICPALIFHIPLQ